MTKSGEEWRTAASKGRKHFRVRAESRWLYPEGFIAHAQRAIHGDPRIRPSLAFRSLSSTDHHRTAGMSSSYPQTVNSSTMVSVQDNPDERWKEALERCRKKTGRDLYQHELARIFLDTSTIDEVMRDLEEKFMDYRARGHKIRGVLRPVVSVVLRFIDGGAEAAAVRTVMRINAFDYPPDLSTELSAWWQSHICRHWRIIRGGVIP